MKEPSFSAAAVLDRHYERELQRVRQRKERYDKRIEIRDIKKGMRTFVWPSTTKLIMAWLIGNCTIVEIYSMVAMWEFMDMSALCSLIAAVVTETISFAVYAAKSYHETKQEEIIKIERSKLELEKEKLSADHSAPDMDETGDPDAEPEKIDPGSPDAETEKENPDSPDKESEEIT